MTDWLTNDLPFLDVCCYDLVVVFFLIYQRVFSWHSLSPSPVDPSLVCCWRALILVIMNISKTIYGSMNQKSKHMNKKSNKSNHITSHHMTLHHINYITLQHNTSYHSTPHHSTPQHIISHWSTKITMSWKEQIKLTFKPNPEMGSK